jgi:signal transduction histidine kinase
LSTLLPYHKRQITTLEEEEQFTETMAELVQTHNNTIPTLARGFLECRKYISPPEVTKFLEQHLRARIGTRLLAEQHIALHMASQPGSYEEKGASPYIGVIDTALRPADIIRNCDAFVSEICELTYGARPTLLLNGEVDAELAHVPVHLEYILTELLKNAYRATVESGNERKPVEVTIAAAPDAPHTKLEALKNLLVSQDTSHDFSQEGLTEYCKAEENALPLNSAAQSITIRIRDQGGGISPEVLPHIWAFNFTTFSNDQASNADNDNVDALNAISGSGGGNSSTIAGLGYGLPLGRAYAEYFGGGIAVESLYGFGTDVYLSLQGVGKIS